MKSEFNGSALDLFIHAITQPLEIIAEKASNLVDKIAPAPDGP